MPVPTVTLEGRVVGDVQFRYSGDSALPVARFRMVCVERKQVDGRWQDGDEFWITVSCFRALATYVADSVNDKDQVVVVGKLTTATWFDDAGAKQSAPKVVANNVAVSLMFEARTATDSTGRTRQQGPPAQQGPRGPERAPVPARGPGQDPQGSDESWGATAPYSGPGTQDDPWA